MISIGDVWLTERGIRRANGSWMDLLPESRDFIHRYALSACPDPDGIIRIAYPDGTIIQIRDDRWATVPTPSLTTRIHGEDPGGEFFSPLGWSGTDLWGLIVRKRVAPNMRTGFMARVLVRLRVTGSDVRHAETVRIPDEMGWLEHLIVLEDGGWVCVLSASPDDPHRQRRRVLLFHPPGNQERIRQVPLRSEHCGPIRIACRFVDGKLIVWQSVGDREICDPENRWIWESFVVEWSSPDNEETRVVPLEPVFRASESISDWGGWEAIGGHQGALAVLLQKNSRVGFLVLQSERGGSVRALPPGDSIRLLPGAFRLPADWRSGGRREEWRFWKIRDVLVALGWNGDHLLTCRPAVLVTIGLCNGKPQILQACSLPGWVTDPDLHPVMNQNTLLLAHSPFDLQDGMIGVEADGEIFFRK